MSSVPTRRAATPITLTALATALLAATPAAPAAADPPDGAWTSTVPALTQPAALYGVTAPRTRTAWAVGSESDGTVPVVLRWDGSSWTRDPLPPGTAPALMGVSSNGPRNAWAVGQSSDPADTRSLHWDGRSWKPVPYPLPTPLAVSVDSRGGAWSAGCQTEADCAVLKYTGGAWTEQDIGLDPLPLATVAARTPRDVWAGGSGDASDPTALRRFDGRTWQDIDFPTRWPQWILQILPVDRDDVWVLTMPFDPLFSGPTLMRYKDGTWTEHKPPRPAAAAARFTPADPGFLGRIAADGRGGVWFQGNQAAVYQHFDGTAWTSVERALPPGGGIPSIYELTQVGRGRTVLGVGHTTREPVIERFR
ncbi:hypothetical protein [Spirillospora albida]|uniref:hypothetical protein n=1 Tax=Spirillospora albida TaxID=58123 RepID=UPI0004C1FFAA|nr:hypothetical protein [Spirillospora albida]